MLETWVWSLVWDNLLEKEMATHSTLLTWEIPWTEKPGSLQSEWVSSVTSVNLTLCNHRDCSLPDSSIHGILQARILEWVAMSPYRGSSWPKDQIHVPCGFSFASGFFYLWATGEAWATVHGVSKSWTRPWLNSNNRSALTPGTYTLITSISTLLGIYTDRLRFPQAHCPTGIAPGCSGPMRLAPAKGHSPSCQNAVPACKDSALLVSGHFRNLLKPGVESKQIEEKKRGSVSLTTNFWTWGASSFP